MTAIDRTAYPRVGERLTQEELHARYDLSDGDLAFIREQARGDVGRLTLATLLKTRQALGLFAALGDIPVLQGWPPVTIISRAATPS